MRPREARELRGNLSRILAAHTAGLGAQQAYQRGAGKTLPAGFGREVRGEVRVMLMITEMSVSHGLVDYLRGCDGGREAVRRRLRTIWVGVSEVVCSQTEVAASLHQSCPVGCSRERSRW